MAITEQIKQDLTNSFRQILMEADTDCGNEILCTDIAERCATAAMKYITILYYGTVSLDKEIEKLIKDGNNE